jgi:CRP-like cAMP-binding protein
MNMFKHQLDRVYRSELTKHYPKGQIVIYADEPHMDICYLRDGTVKVFELKNNTEEKIIHLIKPPALLPLGIFSETHGIVNWYYTALTECDISAISQDEFIATMYADTELAIAILAWYSREMHELMVRLSSFNKTNTYDKLIAALKFLVVYHTTERKNDWWRVTFPVNQQLLADLTGMTRESGATIMKQFKTSKIIRQPHLTILEINRPNLISSDIKQ